MELISVFLDIAKFSDSWLIFDVGRTQTVCIYFLIYIFLWSSLGKVEPCQDS